MEVWSVDWSRGEAAEASASGRLLDLQREPGVLGVWCVSLPLLWGLPEGVVAVAAATTARWAGSRVVDVAESSALLPSQAAAEAAAEAAEATAAPRVGIARLRREALGLGGPAPSPRGRRAAGQLGAKAARGRAGVSGGGAGPLLAAEALLCWGEMEHAREASRSGIPETNHHSWLSTDRAASLLTGLSTEELVRSARGAAEPSAEVARAKAASPPPRLLFVALEGVPASPGPDVIARAVIEAVDGWLLQRRRRAVARL